jgi:hypothetical protein
MSYIKYYPGIPPINKRYEKTVCDTLKKIGVESIIISSTYRTPAAQALSLYDNAEKYGVSALTKLYSAVPRKVLALYDALKKSGKDKNTILSSMENFIKSLGPGNISHHSIFDTVSQATFDILPSSVPSEKLPSLEYALKSLAYKFILPDKSKGEPVYHVELNTFKKTASGTGIILLLCGIIYLILKPKGTL